MYRNITIIGDGAMATVCAKLLCSKGYTVTMWGHSAEQLAEFEAAGENTRFLPGHKFETSLRFDANPETCMNGANLIVSAVPCQFCTGVWNRLKAFVPAGVPIVSVTKGIENHSLLLPTQIIDSVLEGANPTATLSGPNIAEEIMNKLPASACVACADAKIARNIQSVFNTPWFRVYSAGDVIGVQLAGALKNVIAIAAGVIDGIEAGDNAKAALLARGLCEITRLGVAMGADATTFSGLTGLGDLVTTCISPHGRNRSFGEKLGRGLSAEEILSQTQSVVEGVATSESVVELAAKLGVEMPIAESIQAIIKGRLSVLEAIAALMSRGLKHEQE